MTIKRKTFFKNCNIQDRKIFKYSSCIVPISIGMEVHEGEKLESAINLINKSFKECTILIDDTIQRYTMKIKMKEVDLNTLKIIALSEGDKWLKRNYAIFSKIEIPYKILRWDDFLNSKYFFIKKEAIEEEFKNDINYKKAFHFSIQQFLLRFEKNNCKFSSEKEYEYAYELCLMYLKEECACMCVWALNNYGYEVYPSGRNLAMEKTYEKFIKPFNPNIIKSVSFYFKKNKIMKKECEIIN